MNTLVNIQQLLVVLAAMLIMLGGTTHGRWRTPWYRLCRYNGQIYRPWQTFLATDGCNTCRCSQNGLVACTKKLCVPTGSCPKPKGFGVCVELCSGDEDCQLGQKCCSNGCGHVCTIIPNCALVLCARPICIGDVIAQPPPGQCCPVCGCQTSEGRIVRVGESYPAGDGCNTCSCTEHGPICTLRACIQPSA